MNASHATKPNKINKDNSVGLSSGMREEFEIAFQKKCVLIPIGATGDMSEELWKEVISFPEKYYPLDEGYNDHFRQLIQELGNIEIENLSNKILEAIQLAYSL